jgi:hypothetical protein
VVVDKVFAATVESLLQGRPFARSEIWTMFPYRLLSIALIFAFNVSAVAGLAWRRYWKRTPIRISWVMQLAIVIGLWLAVVANWQAAKFLGARIRVFINSERYLEAAPLVLSARPGVVGRLPNGIRFGVVTNERYGGDPDEHHVFFITTYGRPSTLFERPELGDALLPAKGVVVFRAAPRYDFFVEYREVDAGPPDSFRFSSVSYRIVRFAQVNPKLYVSEYVLQGEL